MSIPFSNAVWAQSKMSGGDLLMLLALADMADEHGTSWPAVATLAKRCRVSARQANRSLANLQSAGELEARRKDGRYGTNLYRILLQPGMSRTSPLAPEALTPTSPPPDAHVTPGAMGTSDAHVSLGLHATLTPASVTPDIRDMRALTPVSPKPSLNQQEPSNTARKRSMPPARVPVEALVDAGVDPQHAADWLAVRSDRKLPLTATAWADIQAEAVKAGISIGAAIHHAAVSGWGGFKAAWLKPRDEAPRRGDHAPITTPGTDTRADEFKAAMEQRSKDATKPPAEVREFLRRRA